MLYILSTANVSDDLMHPNKPSVISNSGPLASCGPETTFKCPSLRSFVKA